MRTDSTWLDLSVPEADIEHLTTLFVAIVHRDPNLSASRVAQRLTARPVR